MSGLVLGCTDVDFGLNIRVRRCCGEVDEMLETADPVPVAPMPAVPVRREIDKLLTLIVSVRRCMQMRR